MLSTQFLSAQLLPVDRKPKSTPRSVKLNPSLMWRSAAQQSRCVFSPQEPTGSLTQQVAALDVPLGCKVLESRRAILPGQILVELILQGVQTVAIAGAGAKLGDVEAWSVWHVDHEGVGENHQVVLLRRGTNAFREQEPDNLLQQQSCPYRTKAGGSNSNSRWATMKQ